jgi:hypothetical protein
MNIFYIHPDPHIAAQQVVDSHCVKMILESAQLLSTAHRLCDGQEYVGKSKSGRNARRWRLPDNRESVLYSATHMNHPSSVWARKSSNNYAWLYEHFVGLMKEYTYRYGKQHKCELTDIGDMLKSPPSNIDSIPFVAPPCAMDDIYKMGNDAVESYRKYYREGKSHLHKYTKRDMPEWLVT